MRLRFQKGELQVLPFLQITHIWRHGNTLVLSGQPTEGNMPTSAQALILQTLLRASLEDNFTCK